MIKLPDEEIILSIVKLQLFTAEKLDCSNKELLLLNLTQLKEEFNLFFMKFNLEKERPHLWLNVNWLFQFYKEKLFNKTYDFLSKQNTEKMNNKILFKIHLKFLVFIAKSKVIIKLFYNTLKTPENDLFSQNFESDDWKLLSKNLNEVVN